MFRIYDTDRSFDLDPEEIGIGFERYGIDLSEEEKQTIFAAFDVDGSGTVNLKEMLRQIRPPMSDARLGLIDKAFNKIDKTGDGVIKTDDLKGVYNVDQHPKYKTGQWTKEQCFREFLDKFQEGSDQKDEKVTKDEFLDYYAGVSCEIDRDVYFDYMMRQAWKI